MADLLGYAASSAVLATFLMRTMGPLRLIAILSNVLFLTYGYVQHIYPVFFLHLALLPINLWRIFAVQAGPSVQRRVSGAICASAIGSRPYAFWFVVGLLAGLVGPFPVLLMVDSSKANMLTVPFVAKPPPSNSSPSSQAPSPDQPGCEQAWNKGSDAILVQLVHSAPISLACSRSILPRPYICRLTSLRRVI
jgi:hypothetical protein